MQRCRGAVEQNCERTLGWGGIKTCQLNSGICIDLRNTYCIFPAKSSFNRCFWEITGKMKDVLSLPESLGRYSYCPILWGFNNHGTARNRDLKQALMGCIQITFFLHFFWRFSGRLQESMKSGQGLLPFGDLQHPPRGILEKVNFYVSKNSST